MKGRKEGETLVKEGMEKWLMKQKKTTERLSQRQHGRRGPAPAVSSVHTHCGAHMRTRECVHIYPAIRHRQTPTHHTDTR